MNVRSFRITDEHQIVEQGVEESSPAWFDDPVHRWIDIEAPEREELSALLEPLEVEAEMVLAEVDPGSGFFAEIFDHLLFLRIPTQASPADHDLTHISLLCLPTTLVTIHHEPLPAISELAFRLTRRVRLSSATASALVYQMLGRLAGQNFFAFTACRQNHDALARQLIADSDSVEPEDIFTLRRHITNIGDTNEDHAFCVDILQKLETTSFSAKDQVENLRELDHTLERHQRSMDRLEENVKELHQQFLLAIQDKTGNRLKVLTILSAVFLPLTLVAGIYGMNFENMPELGTQYGYFAVLGFMAFVGVGMLGYFYKKGWFD